MYLLKCSTYIHGYVYTYVCAENTKFVQEKIL